MTFDEMVQAINATGDTFKSLITTASGYQANAQSRHASNSYACGMGATPTEAVRDLYESRLRGAPVLSLEDLE